MKHSLPMRSLCSILILVMFSALLPQSDALADNDLKDVGGLIPFASVAPAPSAAMYVDDEEQAVDYYANVGDFIVNIYKDKFGEWAYPSQQWINATLSPLTEGEPLTRSFYTDQYTGYDWLPKGALILGDTPAGEYEITINGFEMGKLRVLAAGESAVLRLGGVVSYYGGRPFIDYVASDDYWLTDLFIDGYVHDRISDNINALNYFNFLDGKVYLSFTAVNIKPSDVTAVRCGGESVEYTIIPGSDCGGGIRQYFIKLDPPAITELVPGIGYYANFSVTVNGIDYSARLHHAYTGDYYLDVSNISNLKLNILPYEKPNPPQTITIRVFDKDFTDDSASIVIDQDLNLENGKYTLDIPPEAYLFGVKNYAEFCLYADHEQDPPDPGQDWPDFISRLYSDDIITLGFQRGDYSYPSVLNDNRIPVKINGLRVLAYQDYYCNPVYQPNLTFSLFNAAFKPVNGVTIAKDDSPYNNMTIFDETAYKFTAVNQLDDGATYYLSLGAFPFVKLHAVSNINDSGGGDDGTADEPYNYISSSYRYISDIEPYLFSVYMSNEEINPDEWSIKLTNILPGTSQNTQYYAYSDGGLIKTESSSGNNAEFYTSTPLHTGIYVVQFFRYSDEVIEKNEDAGTGDFYYYISRYLFFIPERQIAGSFITGAYQSYNFEPFYLYLCINYNAAVGETRPALTVDFYPVTFESFDTDNVIRLYIPVGPVVRGYWDNTYEIPVSALKSAGLTPGRYYTVISDAQGVVQYTFTDTFTATYLNGGVDDSWDNPYSDVQLLYGCYNAVRYVTINGLMPGFSDTLFLPELATDRVTLADLLYRIEGSPKVSGAIGFTDLETDYIYVDAIKWISQNGILNGYADNTFRPHDQITRELLTVVLYNYARYKGLDVSASADLSQYADADNISPWALDAMQWAMAQELFYGYPIAYIIPQTMVTRAELAEIIYKNAYLFMSWDSNKVTVNVSAGTGGSAYGGGEYDKGAKVTLKASPNNNYTFDAWYENNVKISSEASYSFTAENERTLQARFIYIGSQSTPSAGGSSSASQPSAAGQPTAELPAATPPAAKQPVSDAAIVSEVPDIYPPLAGLYTDVFPVDWFYDAVMYVTGIALMKGTGDGVFSPNAAMSRAMLVTVLYRLEGEPVVDDENDIPFTDVNGGEWYTNAILWAAENGIVNGYEDGAFGIDDPVSREQTVAILFRYAKTKDLDINAVADLSGYADVDDVSDWALSAMEWAVAAGIIQGETPVTIVPQGTSTRAETAMIFRRFINGFLN